MYVAVRNLWQERLRSALSVSSVGLVILLILILQGFQAGIDQSAGLYLNHAPGSVVVASSGVKSFIVSGLPLPASTADRVRQVPEVASVVPLLTNIVFLSLHGHKQSADVIGYDARLGGGPWDLVAGRQPQTDDELVVDRVLAEQHQINLGDHLTVLSRAFTVVGISAETNTWFMSYLFIRKTAAEALLLAPGAATFLLVTPASDTSPEALRDQLRTLPNIEVSLKSELIASDVSTYNRVLGAPIQLMVLIGFLVGVLVIGLMSYTATAERRSEYGVLKAIGARNQALYRVVASQAGIVGSIGAITGIALALLGAQLIMALFPQFLIVIEPLTAAGALAAALVMAFFAALVPARLIARLAPAQVFGR